MKINLRKIALIGLAGFIFAGCIFIYAEHSEGYAFVKQKFEASPAIKERFGSPVNISLPIIGQVFRAKNVYSDTGSSYQYLTIVIKVEGRYQSAKVFVKATRTDGIWKLEKATIRDQPIIVD